MNIEVLKPMTIFDTGFFRIFLKKKCSIASHRKENINQNKKDLEQKFKKEQNSCLCREPKVTEDSIHSFMHKKIGKACLSLASTSPKNKILFCSLVSYV